MNIFNPDNETHSLKIIPRFYPEVSVTVNLKNEETKEVITQILTPAITDGYMYLTIAETFEDNTNLQVEIISGTEVVYRGKIFVTNQSEDTQAYKISKDIFIL